MYKNNTMLVSLTVGELREILMEASEAQPRSTGSAKNYVYGIAGIASVLGCSNPTAQRWKNSGILDPAIRQVGRKIIVDSEMALWLIAKDRGGTNEGGETTRRRKPSPFFIR